MSRTLCLRTRYTVTRVAIDQVSAVSRVVTRVAEALVSLKHTQVTVETRLAVTRVATWREQENP